MLRFAPPQEKAAALDAPGFESGAFESLENDFQEVRSLQPPLAEREGGARPERLT